MMVCIERLGIPFLKCWCHLTCSRYDIIWGISYGRYYSYSKVKKDPTIKSERKLSHTLSMKKDYLTLYKYRWLTHCYTKLAHIYGSPEILKNVIPFSSIFCCSRYWPMGQIPGRYNQATHRECIRALVPEFGDMPRVIQYLGSTDLR